MPRNLLICTVFLAWAGTLSAQQIHPATPPPPPPPDAPAARAPATPSDKVPEQPIDPSTPPPPPDDTAAPAASSEPVFDPLHAERSIAVGNFYFNTGKYDAAIERFIEAANYEPLLAKPWKFLGEAYEKKGMYPKALDSYKKYLELNPQAADAAKIQKRISGLEEKVGKESSKAASH